VDYIKLFKNKSIMHVSDSDLDGISCRLIAEYFIKPVAKNYIPYNTMDRTLPDFSFDVAKECDYIIFTDITPPNLEFYEKIEGKKKVIIFDHHQSGKDILGYLSNYIYDLNRSGNKIFFDELVKGKRRKLCIDQYITLADTYDLYKTDSENWEDAKNLNNVLYGYVNWKAYKYETDTERHRKFCEVQLNKFDKFNKFFFNEYEKYIIHNSLRKENQAYEEAKKNLQFRVDNEGYKYIYTECTSKISLIAYRLLKNYGEKIDYIVLYSTWDKDNLSLSLRSINFDTTYITKKWGGGGHKNASGMVFESQQKLNEFREGKFHLI